MTGYVRQSISEILPGQEVKADPLNEEFNALATAFNSSSGHAHDGTSGSGPKINLTSSVIGNLPANNLGNDSIPHVKLENIADNKVLGNVSGVEASVSTVDILDEDNMVSNRDDALPTQQSVKAYVDTLDAAIVVALDDVIDYVDGEVADLTSYVDTEVSDLQNTINNRPLFRAEKNTNQNGSGVQIFALEKFDVGSGYNPATGQFTAPESGNYFFTASIRHGLGDSGKTPFVMYLRKNSVVEVQSNSAGFDAESVSSSGMNTTSISCLLQLSVNDVVDITTDGSFTTRGDVAGASWFQGFKI